MTQSPNTKSTSWKDATGRIDYPATNDLVFHLILQNNQDVLQGLISSLLHIPLNDIISTIVKNPISVPDYIAGKLFHLDIKVLLNDSSIINLEMQVTNEGNWTDRSLAYLCRSFDIVSRREDYDSVTPTTHIGILDFDLFPDYPEFYSTYKLTNINTHHVFNDKFTLSVLSLNQISAASKEDKAWNIDGWARIFKAKTWEELRMAANTTTLEKVADSIFIQNTDEQIRYAMFKKEEAEIHEAHMRAKIADNEATIANQISTIAEQNATIAEQDATIAEQDATIAELKRTIDELKRNQ